MRELRAIEEGFNSPAAQAIAVALYAYEEQQSLAKGRRFRANRTRQMLERHGALHAAERMVLSRKPSTGFDVLEGAGLQELSFEAIITRFLGEFSAEAVETALARLEGRAPPANASASSRHRGHVESGAARFNAAPVSVDAEAESFAAGFLRGDAWHNRNWAARYAATLSAIKTALSANRPEDAFALIWRTADNSISSPGQGLLGFDAIDGLREELIRVTLDIAADASPENFAVVTRQFERWKQEGRLTRAPRLLIARAFAGVHPRLFHTTVDAGKHEDAIAWFSQHTGFVPPRESNWAARAQALTTHLERWGKFGDDYLSRNMFPWFVLEQLGARKGTFGRKPGHTPRAAEAFASVPPERRKILLRHNQVQTALHERLVADHGYDRVRTEHPTGTGGFADAVVRRLDNRWHLYEIKIADTADAGKRPVTTPCPASRAAATSRAQSKEVRDVTGVEAGSLGEAGSGVRAQR
ncbi:MAG: hypothetical protein LW860_17870, partial [Xanthomonadaceae bacterium]|nr:hypothetical protein [Xanthomonadaceae bacterium]